MVSEDKSFTTTKAEEEFSELSVVVSSEGDVSEVVDVVVSSNGVVPLGYDIFVHSFGGAEGPERCSIRAFEAKDVGMEEVSVADEPFVMHSSTALLNPSAYAVGNAASQP